MQTGKHLVAGRFVRDLWLSALRTFANFVERGSDLRIVHVDAIRFRRLDTGQNPAFDLKQNRCKKRILHNVSSVHKLAVAMLAKRSSPFK